MPVPEHNGEHFRFPNEKNQLLDTDALLALSRVSATMFVYHAGNRFLCVASGYDRESGAWNHVWLASFDELVKSLADALCPWDVEECRIMDPKQRTEILRVVERA